MGPNNDQTTPDADWPAHSRETRAWSQAQRQGPREDRMFHSVDVWLPPQIAGLSPTFPSTLVTVMDDASRAITMLDHGVHANALHREHPNPQHHTDASEWCSNRPRPPRRGPALPAVAGRTGLCSRWGSNPKQSTL